LQKIFIGDICEGIGGGNTKSKNTSLTLVIRNLFYSNQVELGAGNKFCSRGYGALSKPATYVWLIDRVLPSFIIQASYTLFAQLLSQIFCQSHWSYPFAKLCPQTPDTNPFCRWQMFGTTRKGRAPAQLWNLCPCY